MHGPTDWVYDLATSGDGNGPYIVYMTPRDHNNFTCDDHKWCLLCCSIWDVAYQHKKYLSDSKSIRYRYTLCMCIPVVVDKPIESLLKLKSTCIAEYSTQKSIQKLSQIICQNHITLYLCAHITLMQDTTYEMLISIRFGLPRWIHKIGKLVLIYCIFSSLYLMLSVYLSSY